MEKHEILLVFGSKSVKSTVFTVTLQEFIVSWVMLAFDPSDLVS